MTTSIMPPKYNPQEFADFLKSSLADATDLYNRASSLQGITPSQLESARNNMLESQKQYDAALGALSNTNQSASTNLAGSAPAPSGALALAANPFATVSQSGNRAATSGALSTATGASPSVVGGGSAVPATGSVTAAPASGALTTPATGAVTSTPVTGALTTSATGAATAAPLTIQQRLQAAAGADNNLTYSQLMSIANQNNLTLDQIAPYISDPTNRAAVLADLNKFKPSFNALYETYAPNSVNMYAIYQAEELARDGQRVDFTNQNRATQIEAWKRGLFNTPELLAGGTDAMMYYYGAKPVYLTSALTGSNQGATSNRLISTLQNAMQNPGGMGENIKAAVGAYQDPTGKTLASPTEIAAADAYVKRITGNPNATYVNTLRDLDTRGGGFMYDEQRLLGDVKSNLTKGLEANLSISKWDPKTRGEMFAQQINKLKVTPSFVAAALGVSENDILRLATGDPALWSRLAVNELIPTQPVREGASYRYGPAATVSGSNANTALQPTASQPAQTTKTTATRPLNITTVASGQVILPKEFYSLSASTQAATLNNIKVTAADLRKNGLDQTYVDSLIGAGLKNQG